MIRIVHQSAFGDAGFGSSLTLPNMPVFGSNPLLVVCATSYAGSATAVSWNGQSFTKAVEITDTIDANETTSIWYLVPSAPGTYDVNLTIGGNSYKAIAILLNDAAQSSPTDGTGSEAPAAAVLSPDITTAQNNTLVIQASGWRVSNSFGGDIAGLDLLSGQTFIALRASGPAGNCLGVDYEIIATAGTNSFDVTPKNSVGGTPPVQSSCSCLCGFKELNSGNSGGAAFLLSLT